MSAAIPTSEPAQITAGDTWKWTKELSDWSATDGWVLSYDLRKGNLPKITFSATGSGTTHTVNVSAATTALFEAGEWYWQSFVTYSGQRYTVENGRFTVAPNFANTSSFDPRSQVKRTLDAINATLEGTATRDEGKLVVDGMEMGLRSIADLLLLQSRFQTLYQQEVAAERIKAGLPGRRQIVCRMGTPA